MTEQWYWCLSHKRVETARECRAVDRMGPYATAEDARNWKERLEHHEKTWEAEDERWEGDG